MPVMAASTMASRTPVAGHFYPLIWMGLNKGLMMPNAEVTLHPILEKNRSHGSLTWSDQDHICGWRP
jgi:hypothetical protein